MGSSAGFSLLCALCAWIMRFVLIRKNKKMKQSQDETTLFYAY